MRRLFAVILALGCVAAATLSFARGGMGGGHGGFVRDPTIRFGAPIPRVPAMGNRIPAPLAAPAQPNVIDGPSSQPAFRGLTGIGNDPAPRPRRPYGLGWQTRCSPLPLEPEALAMKLAGGRRDGSVVWGLAVAFPRVSRRRRRGPLTITARLIDYAASRWRFSARHIRLRNSEPHGNLESGASQERGRA